MDWLTQLHQTFNKKIERGRGLRLSPLYLSKLAEFRLLAPRKIDDLSARTPFAYGKSLIFYGAKQSPQHLI